MYKSLKPNCIKIK